MTVRAARLTGHGEPLTVVDLTVPPPGRGQVVVDMSYGAVNPVDRYVALGRVAPDAPLPRTLGAEGSGRLDGRPVLVWGHGLGFGVDGVWANTVVVPADAVIEIPDGVDLSHAAAMGVAGVTAWRCVTEKARVTDQDRVLVLGASGGVGSIIVSMCRAIGAEVWGQTTSADKAEWVGTRGCRQVLVTDAGGVVEAAGTFRPTVVFDPLGGGYFGAGVELMADRGRLVIFGTSSDAQGAVPLQMLYRKGITVYGYAGLIEDDETMGRSIRAALTAQRDGRLEVVVDRVLPLEKVNEAFEAIAGKSVRGKVLLDLRDDT